jgi:hypothetical protein
MSVDVHPEVLNHVISFEFEDFLSGIILEKPALKTTFSPDEQSGIMNPYLKPNHSCLPAT